MNASLPEFRRLPYPLASLVHFVIFAVVFMLFLGRKPGVFRQDFITSLAPDFYSHVSNLSISYILYATAGYVCLLAGAKMRLIVLIDLLLILINVTYEYLIPLLNTRDPVDAIYGVGGTLLAFIVLAGIDRFGLFDTPNGSTTT